MGENLCQICLKQAELTPKGYISTCSDAVCKVEFRKRRNTEYKRKQRGKGGEGARERERIRSKNRRAIKGWKELAYEGLSEEEKAEDFKMRQLVFPLRKEMIPEGMTKEENELANLGLWADELRLWG